MPEVQNEVCIEPFAVLEEAQARAGQLAALYGAGCEIRVIQAPNIYVNQNNQPIVHIGNGDAHYIVIAIA